MRTRSISGSTGTAAEPPTTQQDSLSPYQGPVSLLEGLPREGEPTVSAPWGRIVRHTYSLDVDQAWAQVTKAEEKHRSRPPSVRDYAELIDDLGEATRIHELLIQLVPNAELVFARYEADVEALQSDMRAQARRALEAEKSAFEAKEEEEKGKGKGAKGKQITDADVTARMAGSFPDAYARNAEMLGKAKGTRDLLERLRDSWSARRRELETIIKTTRAQ